MRRAQLVFLATFAATGALAGPLASRNNGGKSAASTPWPAIPEPEAYTKPSGPVRVYPISVATGLTSEHGNAEYKLETVGDMVTRAFFSASVTLHSDANQLCRCS